LGEGGYLPPPDFENSDFLGFLPTKFCIVHILPPPPRKPVKILPLLEKTEIMSLVFCIQRSVIYSAGANQTE